MHGGERGTEGARVGERRRRRAPVGREARLVLRHLLRHVRVEGALAGPLGDPRGRVGVDRANAVDRRPDARARAVGKRVHAARPSLGVAVGEAPLHVVGRLADPAVQVAGVEEGHPDPRLGRRLDQRLADLVGIVVADTARCVVEIVELAHARDARERHLGERRPGQREVELGVEAARQLVHGIAPAPEVAAPRLGPAAHRPLEGVRVRVREARDREAEEVVRLNGRRAHARRDRSDPVALDGDDDARLRDVAPEPGELAPIRLHDPTRSTSARARRSKSTR